MTEEKDKSKRAVVLLVEILIGIPVLLGAIWGFLAFLDSRIRKVVDEESYVRRIAAEIRPSVIFDSKGSILADQGAMRYIESTIDIVMRPNAEGAHKHLPAQITIHPKQHLATAPLLVILDPVQVTITADRGQKFDWVFSLGEDAGVWVERPDFKFRLEILQ